jgi:hypothetical protein
VRKTPTQYEQAVKAEREKAVAVIREVYNMLSVPPGKRGEFDGEAWLKKAEQYLAEGRPKEEGK